MVSPIMRALIAVVLCLAASACATVFRGANRELVIVGPPGLQLLRDQQVVALEPRSRSDDGGREVYVASLPKATREVVLRSAGREVPARLQTSVSAGWVVLDAVLYIFPLIIDGMTGSWNNFDQLDAAAWLSPQAEARAPLQRESRAGALGQSLAAAQAPPPRPVSNATGKLAVLDLRNYSADLRPENARYFADVVRGASLRASPRLEVITRENLLVLLKASGRDAATCEGECEVETGRRIGADLVVSGELLKVGSRYKVSLRLHETHEGRLIASAIASGKSVDELDEATQAAAAELFVKLQ